MDNTTLIVKLDPPDYRYPELKVFDVITFDCQRDTSGTYDDYEVGQTFLYEMENLVSSEELSTLTKG